MNKRRYVIGFAFDTDRDFVVLIRKDHPEWQAGKLNGVGGKIEGDESPLGAMVREFHEEAGVHTAPWRWNRVADLQGVDADGWSWDVAVFAARLSGSSFRSVKTGLRSPTSETVEKHRLPLSRELDVVHNLRFLVPLACDPNRPYIIADYEGVEHAKRAAQQDREHHEED